MPPAQRLITLLVAAIRASEIPLRWRGDPHYDALVRISWAYSPLLTSPDAPLPSEAPDDRADPCPVCLEDVGQSDYSEPVTLIPCNHRGCQRCLTDALAISSLCPQCRTEATHLQSANGTLTPVQSVRYEHDYTPWMLQNYGFIIPPAPDLPPPEPVNPTATDDTQTSRMEQEGLLQGQVQDTGSFPSSAPRQTSSPEAQSPPPVLATAPPLTFPCYCPLSSAFQCETRRFGTLSQLALHFRSRHLPLDPATRSLAISRPRDMQHLRRTLGEAKWTHRFVAIQA
eukprot:g2131.t1